MASRILTLLLFLVATAASAGVKQLSGFNAPEPDWYGGWSGATVNRTIDTADKTEGAGSMVLEYTLAGSGSGVEYMHTFPKLQDWSFMADPTLTPAGGLPIKIRSESGNPDKLYFYLYEDQDGDGNLGEQDDEVWVWTSSTALGKLDTAGQPGWFSYTLRWDSFKRAGGTGGNLKLDLNRIRAWRIMIDNPGGTPTPAGTIRRARFDDLRLQNNFVATQLKPISGAFVQIWNNDHCACGNWTTAQWTSEMQAMVNAGMNTLIVQYGVWGPDGNVTAFYPASTSLGWVTWRQSTLDNVFDAALATGMKVVVGLYFDPAWDTTAKSSTAWDDPATYSRLETRNKQVIDDIWSKYGGRINFGGWYIPQEIDDDRWQADSRRVLLAGLFQNLGAYAKAKNASLPVMIAPYFNLNQTADVYRAWWMNFLAAAPAVDWVIPQDGVAANGLDGDTDVPQYFTALKDAITTLGGGRNFGATVESFQDGPSGPGPTTIARLKEQLKVAGALAPKIFHFEMSYMASGSQLYTDYKNLNLGPAP
jgi:hypothetical protein